MALFGKKTGNGVPKEIKDYYQAEKQGKAGVAWLLAVGTMVLTVALAAGLYFGGRLAYRAIFDNDSQELEVAQDDDTITTGNSDPEDEDDNDENQPVTLPDSDVDIDENIDPSGDEDNDSAGNTPTTTPRTGPTLPDTGPGNSE
jgi:hypothetical protein